MNISTNGLCSYRVGKFLKTKFILLHPVCRLFLELIQKNTQRNVNPLTVRFFPQGRDKNKQNSDYYIWLPDKRKTTYFPSNLKFYSDNRYVKQFSLP